ncbi:PTS lactose/cellobiose transporter subunit IIA [Spiroplasma sp. AdecLV25b]|uniref:PTS lactose/cellobiose transporter subunit IIA n=1 Tax=Spiroplasma sp. AdecLV25b TaxID=3027162 RepID=UPI0027DFDD12|nr:PTS lactose/cellobiose transporter subunit IIA [Spiroplasma sp. AdecLV25b]
MTKNEISEKGFEIVALAGDARSLYLKAIKLIKKREYEKAKMEISEANDILKEAHQCQMDLLTEEGKGKYSDLTLIMAHGQDHLMTAILLKELLEIVFLDLYQDLHSIQK